MSKKLVIKDKFNNLLSTIKEMRSVIIAYSGGVDSSLLLKASKLAEVKVLAVTLYSEIMPKTELLDAKSMAKFIGINHKIIKTDELKNINFIKNSKKRCFYCKDNRFKILKKVAKLEGYEFIIEGSNVDDLLDYRPGMLASKKHNAQSPLLKCSFSKMEIRQIAQSLKLPVWDKLPSPCLATRFPYNYKITSKGLRQIELSEMFLKKLGFTQNRVRKYNQMAKIEVLQNEMDKLFGLRKEISDEFKKIGFKHITFDMEGFKSGNLNL